MIRSASPLDGSSAIITAAIRIDGSARMLIDHVNDRSPSRCLAHVVVLRADDIHRSRGIAARWIDIRPEGT
jgi:hypothetical protein